jgi:PEP-CTERM motif
MGHRATQEPIAMFNKIPTHLAALTLATFASTGAQAATFFETITFSFFGDCADCTPTTASAQTPLATLTLKDFTAGDSPSLDNFVSFSYVGSDIVAPYIVTKTGTSDFFTLGDLTVNSTVDPGTRFTTINVVEGTGTFQPDGIQNVPLILDFTIAFDDGLRFSSSKAPGAVGTWYTCSIGLSGSPYYAGSNCNQIANNDFGTGSWLAPAVQAVVPEPSTYLLAGFGLGVLVLASRRKHAA